MDGVWSPKKAIETSIVKSAARFRCSPFPTGVASTASTNFETGIRVFLSGRVFSKQQVILTEKLTSVIHVSDNQKRHSIR